MYIKQKPLKLFFLLLFTIFLFIACSNTNTSNSETGSIVFDVEWPSEVPRSALALNNPSIDCEALGIATVVVSIYDATGMMLKEASFLCSIGEGTVDGIDPGSNIEVYVYAKSAAGINLYVGSETGIAISPGAPTNIGTIELEEVDPGVDSDGDGVFDDQDDCMTIPGDVANKGCPADSDSDEIPPVIGDYYVPGDYRTIQEAIDAASNGEVILVANGTYTGTGNQDLNFNGEAITFQSENGPENCIINCGSNGRGFNFIGGEGPNSVVSGFTITGGNVNYEGGGGAIQCDNWSSPTIKNCIITGNSTIAVPGGGISCTLSSPTIINCIFSNNSSDHSSDGGGAIYCDNASPTIINCVIGNNSTTGDGGGIYSSASNLTIINCTIINNTAGGIYFNYSTTSSVTNTIIWNNTPDQIITQNGADPTVAFSDIEGGYLGESNKNEDPLFASPGDYHLSTGSPCIDSGASGSLYNLPDNDIDGDSRPIGSRKAL